MANATVYRKSFIELGSAPKGTKIATEQGFYESTGKEWILIETPEQIRKAAGTTATTAYRTAQTEGYQAPAAAQVGDTIRRGSNEFVYTQKGEWADIRSAEAQQTILRFGQRQHQAPQSIPSTPPKSIPVQETQPKPIAQQKLQENVSKKASLGILPSPIQSTPPSQSLNRKVLFAAGPEYEEAIGVKQIQETAKAKKQVLSEAKQKGIILQDIEAEAFAKGENPVFYRAEKGLAKSKEKFLQIPNPNSYKNIPASFAAGTLLGATETFLSIGTDLVPVKYTGLTAEPAFPSLPSTLIKGTKKIVFKPVEFGRGIKRSLETNPPLFVGEFVGSSFAFGKIINVPVQVTKGIKFLGKTEVATEKFVEKGILNKEYTFPYQKSTKGAAEKTLKEFKSQKYALDKQLSGIKEGVKGWHETPSGLKSGKIGKGTSETGGLYIAPSQSRYFLKLSSERGLPDLSLFPKLVSPESASITVKGIERLPKKVRTQGFEKASKFLETKAEKGKAYISPAHDIGKGIFKSEKEAIIPPESFLSPIKQGNIWEKFTGFKYYQTVEGQKIPIKEYKTFTAKETANLSVGKKASLEVKSIATKKHISRSSKIPPENYAVISPRNIASIAKSSKNVNKGFGFFGFNITEFYSKPSNSGRSGISSGFFSGYASSGISSTGSYGRGLGGSSGGGGSGGASYIGGGSSSGISLRPPSRSSYGSSTPKTPTTPLFPTYFFRKKPKEEEVKRPKIKEQSLFAARPSKIRTSLVVKSSAIRKIFGGESDILVKNKGIAKSYLRDIRSLGAFTSFATQEEYRKLYSGTRSRRVQRYNAKRKNRRF